jgi:hypothetical protein
MRVSARRVGLGNRTDLVGGEFTPDGYGSGSMDASSGHFGENNNPQTREQIRSTLQENGAADIEIDGTFC